MLHGVARASTSPSTLCWVRRPSVLSIYVFMASTWPCVVPHWPFRGWHKLHFTHSAPHLSTHAPPRPGQRRHRPRALGAAGARIHRRQPQGMARGAAPSTFPSFPVPPSPPASRSLVCASRRPPRRRHAQHAHPSPLPPPQIHAALLAKVLRLPMAFFDSQPTGAAPFVRLPRACLSCVLPCLSHTDAAVHCNASRHSNFHVHQRRPHSSTRTRFTS